MDNEIPIIGMCTKCGFYNDCPLEYLCPAAEILLDLLIDVFEGDDE